MSKAPPEATLPAGLSEPAFDSNALRVLKERYFAKKIDGTLETPQEFLWRVASSIAQPERSYAQRQGRDPEAVVDGVARSFYDMMARRDFMPNTPCLVNAGRPLSMLSACFVLPVPDSIEGIFYSVKAMALIQKSGGGCVAGDSRVWSTFCGLEPIEVLFSRTTADGRPGEQRGNGVAYDVRDLDVRTLAMDPKTGASGLRKVTHVWKFEVPAEQQLAVRTREGTEIQTSAWHPFLVLRGTALAEVRADELSAGDVILGPEKPDAYWPWREYRTVAGLRLDEETAWLAGFTLGDVSFGRNALLRADRVRWFSGTSDVLERVQSILAKHGIRVRIQRDPRGQTLYLTTLNQRFVHALRELCGIVANGPKDLTIRIPEMIGKSPLSVVRAFLAGLVDSDGNIDKDGSPFYCTASEGMALDLTALMSLLGFQATVRKRAPYGNGKNPTYSILLARIGRVAELASEIVPYLANDSRKARLLASSELQESAGKGAPEASLLERVSRFGHQITSVSQAAVPKAYYDLSVEDWNTYAAGRYGMAMIHNTGFAFSDLRHQGAEVNSTGRDASGPVSFMKVFNAATDSIKQGGVRRGANMGVLRVDHPDIFQFMRCKKELDAENTALWNRLSDTGRYTPQELAHLKQELLQTQIANFNISVGVTDEFMTAVENDSDFDLRDPRTGKTDRTVRAREIWDAIVEGAWQNGEPGVLFLDHPEWNPLPGLGPIQATNPCVTGDTLVAVADGRGHVRIDELAASGKDVPVFCMDDAGAVHVRTMRRPRKTGENVPVYKVTLDDGSVLRATANHRFRLRTGGYREVKDLVAGDSLRIMTRFQASIKDVFRNGSKRSQDYWWVNAGRANNRLEHRYIAEFHFDSTIPAGYVVHHRDFNAQNNTPGNLAVISRQEHDDLHRLDKLGDKNPMRRALQSWDAARWTEYKAKHSANNAGERNKRFSGVTNEQLREAALELTRGLGRRFSVSEWVAYARGQALPEQFSGWRRAHLNGSVPGLAKWAAAKLGLEIHAFADPRVIRHFLEALEQGYDPEIVGGVLFVLKRCEICDDDFRVSYTNREIAYCSANCNTIRLNRDPAIHAKRHAARRVTLDAKRSALAERQLDVYTELRVKSGSVLKRDWVAACRSHGVSAEISRESSPFRTYGDLQDAATTFNHRVVSVELDSSQDVYNGTVDEFHNFFVGGFAGTTANGKPKFTYVCNAQCGEQSLHGWDSCNLGSINVGHFFDERAKDVDWERLAQSTALAIRFLDNVIDANIYPLKEIEEMVRGNRRVGLGIMGFADLLIHLRIAYGSPEAIAFAGKLMKFMQRTAEDTSEQLARERGDFPNKHLSKWATDSRPRRNAALLSIAPTGTISMIAGCSFGCEPYFGMAYTKHVMKDAQGRPQHLYYVVPLFEEAAKNEGFFSEELLGKIEENRGSVKGLAEVRVHWQDVFTTSADVSVDQHIDMLAAFQKYTCNAVSKTINAPNDDTRENVSRAIFRAYRSGCKGFTYYRDGSRTEQVVTFSKDGDIKEGNRDVTASASPAAPQPEPSQTNLEELDIEALLARANALLEVT